MKENQADERLLLFWNSWPFLIFPWMTSGLKLSLMPFKSKILQLLSLKMSSLPWSYMWKFLNAFQSRAGKNLALWKWAYVGICHIDIQQIIIRIAQLHWREGSAEPKQFSSLLLQLIDFFSIHIPETSVI